MASATAKKRTPKKTPLAVARAERSVSLSLIAKAIGFDKGNLSRIEHGMVRPSADVAIRLAEYFDGSLTRDQIMFPEFHDVDGTKKKPVARAEA